MPGRNDPCSCSSGHKFKKCCGDPRRAQASEPLPPDVLRTFAKMQKEQHERVERYGHVRQIIHADFAGYKFVAAGAHLYHSSTWRTFPDFLLTFIKQKFLPDDWYQEELKKPLEERHPVAQWYWHYCHFQARHRETDENGLHRGVPDGPSRALMILAYDLYVLEDNLTLQAKLIQRLRHPEQFQGARYEVTVTATMIRAGFSIELEDEGDVTKPHPEFVATHKTTGIKVAVEAKSRHRPGVLGRPGEFRFGDSLAKDVAGLFSKALKKASDLPLFVFIDANLPMEIALSQIPNLQADFDRMVSNTSKSFDDCGMVVGHSHNLLTVTNMAHHYGHPGQIDLEPMVYMHYPNPRGCRYPVASALINTIEAALRRYGNVPNEFPNN